MERLGHRLLQLGLALFLFALLLGLAIPRFPVPRLGLSAHLLGLTQGLFLLGVGLAWPRLQLGERLGRAAFALLVYGCLAALASNLASTALGGHALLPIASAGATGAPALPITVGLRSGGAALLAGTALLLFGLRRTPP